MAADEAHPSAADAEFDAVLAEPASTAGAAASHRHAHVAVEPAQAGASDFAANWDLYRDPVLCAVLAGVGLGALGVFVLLRRAVFVTAALSQAAGLGVALAFYLDIHWGLHVSPILGAVVGGVLATLLVGLRRSGRIPRETLVGTAFLGTSAAAVLVGDRIAQEAHDIATILFGSAVLVRRLDLAFVAAGTAVSFGALLLLGRALTFTGFDAEGARVQGLPVRAIETSFWAVFAIEVSVATRALGSLPVFALAVLPAAAGLVLAERVRTAIVIAVVAGAASGGLGYVVAFLHDLPVGAAQAAIATLIALAAAGISRLKPA